MFSINLAIPSFTSTKLLAILFHNDFNTILKSANSILNVQHYFKILGRSVAVKSRTESKKMFYNAEEDHAFSERNIKVIFVQSLTTMNSHIGI